MFCPKCGKDNSGNDRFCVQCGNDLSAIQGNDNNNNNNSQLTDMFSTSSSSNTPQQVPNMNNNNGMDNQQNNMNQPFNNTNNNQPQQLNSMYNQPSNNMNNNNTNKGNTIVKVIAFVVAFIVGYLVMSSILGSGGSTKSSSGSSSDDYGLVCTNKYTEGKLVEEREIKLKQQESKTGNYVSSRNTIKVYKSDHSKITDEQYKAFMKEVGELGFNQESSNDGTTITITYTMSHLTVPTLAEAKKQLVAEGYKCY